MMGANVILFQAKTVSMYDLLLPDGLHAKMIYPKTKNIIPAASHLIFNFKKLNIDVFIKD